MKVIYKFGSRNTRLILNFPYFADPYVKIFGRQSDVLDAKSLVLAVLKTRVSFRNGLLINIISL